MSATPSVRTVNSAKALTVAAHAAFVPIGIVTVLLAPLLPTLSAQWSLNYSQAGGLFTAQYVTSTLGVGLSGWLVTRWGYRFAIKGGLVVCAAAVAMLMSGSRTLGLVCIAGYGLGLGLAVPPCNLLVAMVNPQRRSAALNLLNFSWSAGAVACPFLIAGASKGHHIPGLLWGVAAFLLLVAIGIALMPASVAEPAADRDAGGNRPPIPWRNPALPVLAALFFVYVGVENAFGGWVASYAKSLGTMALPMALATPSFFYSMLMLGRWIAPFVLRSVNEIRVAQGGLILACLGMAGLEAAHTLTGVALSASLAGLGLAAVYPITIALAPREFGAAASRIGSLLFFAANLGGGCLPWMVGAASNSFGTLKVGIAVPLLGSALMLMLYQRKWSPEAEPAS